MEFADILGKEVEKTVFISQAEKICKNYNDKLWLKVKMGNGVIKPGNIKK